MQWFNDWLIILKLVNRNVDHRTNKARIVRHVHVYFRSWEWNLTKGLLHLWIPLFHELVELRHVLRVVNGRWRPAFMKILNGINPTRNFFGLLISILNWINVHWGGTYYIFRLNIFELEYCFVLMVKSRLIEHHNTQIFFLSIRFRHLKESIDLSNCWDVLRNERLKLCIQINLLWFIPVDIFKEFLGFATDR